MSAHSPLSEAARRVIDAAIQSVSPEGQRPSAGPRLLKALWEDESRAAEILRRTGVTDDVIVAFASQEPAEACAAPSASPSATTAPLPTTDPLPAIVEWAQRHVTALHSGAELGTEHLLAALVSVDEATARLLRPFGLSESTLREQITPPRSAAEPAIDIDVRLDPAAAIAPQAADVARILDAAANRGREGLRVVEDYTRFILNDPHLSAALKHLRHELAGMLADLGAARWIAARDTPGDVGVEIHTATEMQRGSASDVARANGKRVQESLRTLEEFGKLTNPAAAARLGQLRYRFYTLEQAIETSGAAQARLAEARLYLLLTDNLCLHGWEQVVREALRGGVDVVQLRNKEASDRRLLDQARRLRDLTREANALFIVNDRPDLAVLAGADGVHLGQDDLPVAAARRIVGVPSLIGVSTHSIEQARQAVLDGADYLGVGPTFVSHTKSFADYAGLDFVRAVAAEISLPWFAIGGINGETIGQAIAAGARRVAVSHALCAAPAPSITARHLRSQLPST